MPKHEIELQERKKENTTYIEILTSLADGKIYDDMPSDSKPLPQAAQKGNTCWYYALSRIRKRYGKNSRPHANRHVEKTISEYRKELTSYDLLPILMNKVLDHLPLGLKKEELELGKLDACMEDKLKKLEKSIRVDLIASSNVGDSIDKFKKEQSYYSLFMKIKLILSVKLSANEAPAILNQILDLLCKDILTAEQFDKIKQDLKNTCSNKNLMAAIFIFNQPSSIDILDIIKGRLAIFILAMFDALNANTNINTAIDYLCALNKVLSLQQLYKNLHIQADQAFFERMLTTAVYNSSALSLAKKAAKEMTDVVNSGNIPFPSNNISAEDIKTLQGYFALGQAFAYSRIVELYDLKRADWAPNDGFSGLTQAINKEGPLVVVGHVGLPFYQSNPQTLMEDNKPVKIGSRTILFWPNHDFKPLDSEDRNCHAILVIGTQTIKNADDTQEYVFFLDPNDASIPGEERKVYQMRYTDLVANITMQSGVQITDPHQHPKDGFYAVAGRGC